MGLRFVISDDEFATRVSGGEVVKHPTVEWVDIQTRTGRMRWLKPNIVQNPCGEIALSPESELKMFKHRTHDDQIDAMRYCMIDARMARSLHTRGSGE